MVTRVVYNLDDLESLQIIHSDSGFFGLFRYRYSLFLGLLHFLAINWTFLIFQAIDYINCIFPLFSLLFFTFCMYICVCVHFVKMYIYIEIKGEHWVSLSVIFETVSN